MKDQLIITFLAHLLKQHESEPLTLELTDRLTKSAILHAKTSLQNFYKRIDNPVVRRKPYQDIAGKDTEGF